VGELLLILIGTGLVSNLVLDYMLGTDPVVALSRKPEPAFNLCILMIIVMPIVALIANILNFHVLIPQDLLYLQLFVLVLVSTAIVISIGNLTRRFRPELSARTRVFIPLLIVNCTVLGVALLGIKVNLGLTGAFFFGLGSALGFSLVVLAVSAINERVAVADVPTPVKGIAILMITLGLLSMAFMGFDGIGKPG